jgi:hypothetical protein
VPWWPPNDVPTPAVRTRAVSVLRIALGLALVPVGSFYLFAFVADKKVNELHPDSIRGVPDPVWMSVLWAVLPLLPYLLCFVLLSTRNLVSVIAGAGIGAGLFGWILMLAPGMCMGLFLGFGLSQAPYFFPTAISLLLFFAISVWIVVSAFWIGKDNGMLFFVLAGITWACMGQGFSALRMSEYRSDRKADLQKQEAYLHPYRPSGARQTLVNLAGCLLVDHSVHPDAGFPATLAPAPANWDCEAKFAANAVPDFTFSYIPQSETLSGKIGNFQLKAVPQKKGPEFHTLILDRRGVVFVDYAAERQSVFRKMMVIPSDLHYSQIDVLRKSIEAYAKARTGGEAPAVLNPDVIGGSNSQVLSISEDGLHLETKNFAFRYFPPRPGQPQDFALSAQCQSYGKNCLRSYFLDYKGVIHATGEPRPATADDPPALDCEDAHSECKDADLLLPTQVVRQ